MWTSKCRKISKMSGLGCEAFGGSCRTVTEPRLAGTDLFIASDFSGSHKGSRYNVYNFLLVILLSVGEFLRGDRGFVVHS